MSETCKQCGATFEKRRKDHVFCSRPCKKKYYNATVTEFSHRLKKAEVNLKDLIRQRDEALNLIDSREVLFDKLFEKFEKAEARVKELEGDVMVSEDKR